MCVCVCVCVCACACVHACVCVCQPTTYTAQLVVSTGSEVHDTHGIAKHPECKIKWCDANQKQHCKQVGPTKTLIS